jgi:hypothetical protein
MSLGRTSLKFGLALLLGVSTVRTATAADKYTFKEKYEVGDQWQTSLTLQLDGNLLMRSGEKVLNLTLKARAEHQFPERLLNLDSAGQPIRVARQYEQAKATITVQGAESTRTLRPARKLQVAQRIKDETVTYAPSGPLTREELELAGEHLDVLMVPALLPEVEVGIGDTWDVVVPAIQALVGLDGVINQDVKGKLQAVQGDVAQLVFIGTVEGISNGAEVKTSIGALCLFNLKAQRITMLEWKQREERQQGPVSPGAKTESVTTMKRTLGAKTEALSDATILQLPAEPAASHLTLSYRDPKARYELLHERSWHVVAQTDQYTVLRMLERGELIAQVNIVPWEKAKPGQHISEEDLKKLVESADSFALDQIVQSGTVPADAGYWIHRITAAGKSNETAVLQNYYAVASPQGEQVMLIFTTEVNQAEKLAGRDLTLVGTLRFTPAK